MSRLETMRWVVIAGCAVVLLRLMDLQVVRGAHFRQLAESNRLRVIPDAGPRGLILDRRGRVLAGNRTVFRLVVVPQEVQSLPDLLSRVSALVDEPVERLTRTFALQRSLPFLPATIVFNLPKPLALRLEEQRLRLRGAFVRPETVRDYPMGRMASHLLGYLNQPLPEELPVLKRYGVRPQHLIGRAGLERLLDAYLRGKAGGRVVEVDARARQVNTLGQRRAQVGETAVLTLDASLQSLIEEAFGDQPGAAVVLRPQTGDVLALVSVPTFSPAAFVNGDTQTVAQLLTDARSPLLNRATLGRYTPGSIAKLITASAALEAGVITPATTFTCSGALTIGDRTFHCWNRDGHGALSLGEALRDSCNVYFMQVARRLGADRLEAGMAQIGWGRPTGWVLDEATGRLPGRRLTEGELAILGIGQGEVEVTALQAAVMVSAFANGGWIVKPWVVKAVGTRDAGSGKVTMRRLGWSDATLQAVRGGMHAVVASPQGTGHRAWTERVSVAGKTGTAQTHVAGRPHGWFVGFCPAGAAEPRVAMAIVVEHGGSGGDLPAEIARTICEYAAVMEPF